MKNLNDFIDQLDGTFCRKSCRQILLCFLTYLNAIKIIVGFFSHRNSLERFGKRQDMIFRPFSLYLSRS